MTDQDIPNLIKAFTEAKDKVLETYVPDGPPAKTDDIVAHIEAKSHYGVLIESVVNELGYGGYVNEITMMRLQRAISFKPDEGAQSEAKRASEYHRRFIENTENLIEKTPWAGRYSKGIGPIPKPIPKP